MLYNFLILVHICSALFWGGGILINGFFFVPAVLEAGPGGGAVMGGVMKRGFATVMTLTGVLAILSGLGLYGMRFSLEWLKTSEGICLSLGGLLALSAFGIGIARQRPLSMKLGMLAKEGRQAEIPAVAAALLRYARVTAWHLLAVVLLMAGHRLASMF